MHIRNPLFDFCNRCLGIRNYRVSIFNHDVGIRNHDVGIDCQLGLKGAAEFAGA